MNNAVHFIQHLIDKIEDKLEQDICTDSFAVSFNVSQWHFQRLFKALVGDDIETYIQGRRLNTGTYLLLTNQQSIPEIALSVGFNSTAAFCHAFKQENGFSPTEFRLEQDHIKLKDKPNLNQAMLGYIAQSKSLHPHIRVNRAITLVGYQAKLPSPFIKDENQYLSLYPAWKQIMKHQDHIQNRIKSTFYGITTSASGDFTEPEVNYMAGVPVTALQHYPETAIVHHLPEQLVALFDVHDATLESKERIIDYIYGYWLAHSDYERGLGDDYEIFDHIVDVTNPDKLKSQYVIPIRKKHR